MFVWLTFSAIFGFSVASDTLQLVHVLFRHGNRTSDLSERYPLDPYGNETYFPIGDGQLTTAGKLREYSIGKYLKLRYGDFLGDLYYPELLDPISSDYNRTKASLELVLAGLFPPVGNLSWNPDLPWQPIPYNYKGKYDDEILLGTNCPNYIQMEQEYLNSLDVQKDLQKYKDTFKFIATNTGLNITNYGNVYDLYFGLSTEEEWGFKLPEWTEDLWPDKIVEISVKQYNVYMGTLKLKRINAGYLLEKIIADTQKKIDNPDSKTKMHLYSAHENNVAQLLMALDNFDEPHVPTYGSFVIIEIHKVKEEHVVKLFYQNYSTAKPVELSLKCGKSECTFNDFKDGVKDLMPTPTSCRD